MADCRNPVCFLVFFHRNDIQADENGLFDFTLYDEFQRLFHERADLLGLELVNFRVDGTHAYKICGRDGGDGDVKATIEHWIIDHDGFDLEFILDWPLPEQTEGDG